MREQYGIAAMTAARVIRTLTEEGLVVSDSGRGVFVAENPALLPAERATTDERLRRLEARVEALEHWTRRAESSD
jgi:DNA-binding GntR family transcriptional regulator